MKKSAYLEILILIFVSIAIALSLTRFEYGHNLWNRYCREQSSFTTKPICQEATLKKEFNSEEFQKEDYFYLSIRMPITGAIQDTKNPIFGSSTTVSQWGYALMSLQFYLSLLLVFAILAATYFIIKKLLLLLKH